MRTHTLIGTLFGIAVLALSTATQARDFDRDHRWSSPPPTWNHQRHWDHDDHRRGIPPRWRDERRSSRPPIVREHVYFYGPPPYYPGYRGYHPATYYRYGPEPSLIINLPPIVIR